jgi:hypothetical protein
MSKIDVMGQPKVGLNSYVEIAVCMANQDTNREKLKHSTSKSTADWSVEDYEIQSPQLRSMEWRKRITEWQNSPDNGFLVEDYASLDDLPFGVLFLQHPFAAMAVWNVMQRFYALDRLVCGTSRESLGKIIEWEKLPPFEYLGARRVKRLWKKSLKEFGREIRESSLEAEADAPKLQPENGLSLFSRNLMGTQGTSKGSNGGFKSELLLRRIDGIFSGISKLESSLKEVRRSLRENLENTELVDSMLERIVVAAGKRFSMIDTDLKMEESKEAGNHSNENSMDSELSGKLDRVWIHEILIS